MSFANPSNEDDGRVSRDSDDTQPRDGEATGGPRKFFRVAFDLPDEVSSWAQASVERLWTAKTDVKMVFRIQNSPFYVLGIAFGDQIRIRADHDRRELVFDGTVVARSEHSTIRLILKRDDVADVLDGLLRRHDCPWEIDSTGLLWAVDVVATADYAALRSELVLLANQGGIGIQEACVSGTHRAQLN